MTRRSSPFEVCGLKPIRQDSEGPLFDPAEAATMIANSINADTNYFQRKTKDMNTDFAKTESATRDAIAFFERSLSSMVDAAYIALANLDTTRTYPDAPSDALRHVLGLPNYRCAPYAHLMRDRGADIDTHSEDGQAHVLHWLVKLILDHGDRSADAAEVDLDALRGKARAAHDGEVTR